MAQQPHQRPTSTSKPQPSQSYSDFVTFFLRRMQQKYKVIRQLPQANSSTPKMPLDVSQLHHESKRCWRHIETFGGQNRFRYFTFQVTLQTPVCKGVNDPGRGFKMDFDIQPLRTIFQMKMMSRFEKSQFLIVRHPEIIQHADNAFASTRNPDVDVPALAIVRVGIEPSIGRPLEDCGLLSLSNENICQVRRLAVQQRIVAPDKFRLARPLMQ